ncbi:MAG: hypothetical protein KBF15_03160 [Parabacteroides sp.]|nr:hypothetical protein [Parabacteroides sp.]
MEKKQKYSWISLNPGGHFKNLTIKTDFAFEKDLDENIYSNEDSESLEHVCNLIKSMIKASCPNALDWYDKDHNLPNQYEDFIDKLKSLIKEYDFRNIEQKD